jgi:hypothetical protein
MPIPLIIAAQRLLDILEQENDALRVMDLRRAAGFLPEKTAAIADLTAAGEASSGPAAPSLVPVARRLDDVASRNRLLLERAIVAQQRVIGIVVRAAANSGKAESSYGNRRYWTRVTGPMALSTRA